MSGALTIRRLHADCRVAGPPRAATDVGDRTSRALRDHLPLALRAGLGAWLDGEDESVWIVRRLELSVMTAADSAPADIAAITVNALGRALASTLSGDGDGVNAIRFAGPAQYLAQFVVDATASDVWGHWYYQPFDGLRALSLSAVIRTALIRDVEQGRAALRLLDDRKLARVAGCITASDERALLEVFATEHPDWELDERTVAAAARACRRALDARIANGRDLFAVVRADAPWSAALRDAVRAIGSGIDAAHATHLSGRDLHVDAIEEAVAQRLSSMGRADLPSLRRTIVDAVTRELRPDGDALHDDARPEPWLTRFGGLVLLVRDLDALPWEKWTDGWPPPPAGRTVPILKWLTLMLCSGRSHVLDATRDAVWRRTFDVPMEMPLVDVCQWLRRVGRVRARIGSERQSDLATQDRRWLAFPRGTGITRRWEAAVGRLAGMVVRGFAARLPGFAESTVEHLWRNVLDMEATFALDADRVLVQCGRPPLHLLLTMTGMTRGLLAGRDAEGRPMLVFSRG